MLFDTHCHLDDQYFPDGAVDALVRARSAGVSRFTCIGVGGLVAAQAALAIARREPDVFATVGVHPHDAAKADAALIEQLVVLAADARVVAIGEVGLDYHYDHSPRELQRDVFRRFIGHARALKKPIVVHTRNAPADTLDILEQEDAAQVGGIIHCFSEDRAFAERALELGFDLSFSGIVTFKNAKSIRDVAAWAPADRILLETDSPYLAPQPLRGRPCEPAFVLHTARFVAELRGVSLESLAESTTRNALRRFGLESSPSPVHHQ
ncbi:MAG TPA: TatD family hydrolase [Polyangiaceae bacterium]|jgi:TatD DNase family protein|nr:TatD family hydrolase [Polyangiaceae bacterium]